MGEHLKVIIDYDGTLTAEEEQVAALAEQGFRYGPSTNVPGPTQPALPPKPFSWTLP